ncbi:MAG: translation elongation factor Ts [Peptococcaceae bacterium]|nr:translation elongation factor Ts [Peptococcaceae bacterium]
MAISANAVKELRERTGAGMMDCKKALTEVGGELEKAVTFLREKGLASAAKKAGRIAAEGIVEAYIHGGGRIGVLVEINCETDFVAKTDEFRALARDIAMQVAAARPEYVRREDVPAAAVEKERAILAAQAAAEGKPAKVMEKMVEGRLDKFFKDKCLLEQAFIKNPDQTVQGLLVEKIARIGENINVRRFARYEMGEGLARREDDFAAEVAQMAAGK